MDELSLLRALTTRLPPLPKMRGLANHVARRFYLRQPRPLSEARVHGLRLQLDPAELTEGLMLFTPQLFDRREIAFLRQHLRPGDTFLDLGAHVGLYGLVAATVVGPGGRVLAVEPEPISRERLVAHIRANRLPWVQVEAVGLSDRAETRHLAPGPLGNRGSTRLVEEGDSEPVPCLTVSELLAEHGIAQVDGAKLDLEGADARVLARWLTDGPLPRFLVVEQLPGADLVRILTGHGYRHRRGTRDNLLAWRDG